MWQREAPAGAADVTRVDLVEEDRVLGYVDVRLEVVRVLRDVVLAHVERGSPDPVHVGEGVGHVDVVEREPVDDRPDNAVLLVADLVEDEPLARREADAEVPALPGDFASVDPEARSVGLCDDERLESGTGRVGVARERGVDGADAGIGDVENLEVVHVDRGDDALDRAVIGIRQCPAEERQGAKDAAAGRRPRSREVAGCPDVEVDVIRIEPAVAHRLLPARVGANEPVDVEVLGCEDGRLAPGPLDPRGDLRLPQVDDRLEEAVVLPVVDVRQRLTPEGLTRRPREHLALRWLLQADEREERASWELAVCLDDLEGRVDLGCGQRVERMSRRGRIGNDRSRA